MRRVLQRIGLSMVDMVKRMNRTVRNPATSHRITFLQTAEQTNGELLQIMYAVEGPETTPAVPPHIHLQCEERFEVVQGQPGVVLDGKRRLLSAGEEVFIPTGTPHTFWNAGEIELRFISGAPAGPSMPSSVSSPCRITSSRPTVFIHAPS